MGELVFKGRIAVPGDLLARGLDFLPGKGTFRLNEEIRSKTVGLVKVKNKVVAVIPLAGISQNDKSYKEFVTALETCLGTDKVKELSGGSNAGVIRLALRIATIHLQQEVE